jgi:hypothetical protein
MVKPTKSMQPENVDLVKAGRKTGSGSSFGEDSFHNYMALKIAGQREQFGLVIPPPPIPEKLKDSDTNRTTSSSPTSSRSMKPTSVAQTATATATATQITARNAQTLKLVSSFQVSDINKKSRTNGTAATVRFVEGVKSIENSRPKKKRTKMESIIHRLERRHGRGSKSLERKKRIKTKHSDQEENKNHDACTPPSVEEDSITELARIFSMADDDDNDGDDKDSSSHDIQDIQDLSVQQQSTQTISTIAFPIDEEEETITKIITTPSSSPKSIRKSRPDLFFYGVVVKVAGYTNPDTETIKRLLQKHGGDYETYETERVTHIIAEQLSVSWHERFCAMISSIYFISF